MKRRRQCLIVLLIVAMVSSMFAGCGKNPSEPTKGTEASTSKSTEGAVVDQTPAESKEDPDDSGRISKETIELTISGPYQGNSKNWTESIQFTEYEKRLGIKLNATTYDKETWPNKFTLMLTGDTLPDIVANASISKAELYEYGQDGYFLDLSQYLHVMPNLSKIMQEYPDYARHITMENGAIYGLSNLSTRINSNNWDYLYISEEWLDRVGKELPKTLDEFYEVLVAFKEQDANGNGDPNDEIPMIYSSGQYVSELPILWSFGIRSREKIMHPQADENGNVVLMNTTENYRDFLRFMHKLYDEKLINEDAFVISNDEMKEKIKAGKTGFNGNMSVMFTEVGTEGDYEHQKWVYLPGLTNEDYDSESIVVPWRRVTTSFKVMVNANTEHPEEIAKFIDYLYTDEGVISTTNGYEGVSFDYVMKNGQSIMDTSKYDSAYASGEEYRTTVVIAQNSLELLKINKGTIYEPIFNAETDKVLECLGEEIHIGCASELGYRTSLASGTVEADPFPILSYKDDEIEERTILHTDINNYLTTVKTQFITGEMDLDDDWDSYLAELEKMGLKRYLEIEQAAYDRYIGK